jgi:hypothetical protein
MAHRRHVEAEEKASKEREEVRWIQISYAGALLDINPCRIFPLFKIVIFLCLESSAHIENVEHCEGKWTQKKTENVER